MSPFDAFAVLVVTVTFLWWLNRDNAEFAQVMRLRREIRELRDENQRLREQLPMHHLEAIYHYRARSIADVIDIDAARRRSGGDT